MLILMSRNTEHRGARVERVKAKRIKMFHLFASVDPVEGFDAEDDLIEWIDLSDLGVARKSLQ